MSLDRTAILNSAMRFAVGKAHFLLVIAVVLFCAEVWYIAKIVRAVNAEPVTTVASGASAAPKPKQAKDINVASLHLFGASAASADTAPLAASLGVTLEGIMGADSHTGSGTSALVRLDEGGTKLVKVGSTIVDGVKVHEIRRDSIIIDNHGKLERMQLHKPPALFH